VNAAGRREERWDAGSPAVVRRGHELVAGEGTLVFNGVFNGARASGYLYPPRTPSRFLRELGAGDRSSLLTRRRR
jgi:hypothetical protein